MAPGRFAAVQNHGNLVPLLHIRRACNDLNGFPADIHLTDDQFVRVRMTLDLYDLSHDDLLQVLVQTFISFYFGS